MAEPRLDPRFELLSFSLGSIKNDVISITALDVMFWRQIGYVFDLRVHFLSLRLCSGGLSILALLSEFFRASEISAVSVNKKTLQALIRMSG